MKIIIYISLFLIGLASSAQVKPLSENFAHPSSIESVADFNKLSLEIQHLQAPKQKRQLWSAQFLKTLKNAKQWAEIDGNSEQKLLAQYYLLMYYNNHIDDDKIISLSKDLLLTPSFMEMPESVYTLFALNSSYRRKGFYKKQIKILNSLIEQNQKFKNITEPVTYGYYNELALVYYNLKQYRFARVNFQRQANVFEKDKDYFRTSSMLNNIGLTYAKQNVLDSALTYHKKALSMLETRKINDDFHSDTYINHFKNIVKSNIAKIDTVEGNFASALSIFKAELASSKQVKELSSAAQAYQKIADLYYENGDFNLAKIYVDSTLAFEKRFPNPNNRQKAFLLKAKIALKQDSNSVALSYFDLANALRDSLTRENEAKNYSEATAKYNFIKTGEALEENIKLLQQKEEANTIQLFFLCLVVILLLIIGAMLIKSKKANKLIAIQKEELHKGLKEKETMLDEIHHRIKNNLQVVSGILELQRGKIDSEKHAKIYEESQKYLHSMSMIHEHLYEQDGVSKLNMQMYLNRLCDLLINSYPDVSVNYEASAPTVRLNIKMATPLALIICELITNSLKHAFKKSGTIKISLSKQEDTYVLNYSDNGIGFIYINEPEYFNTGLNLITMLTEDLNGKVSFSNRDGFKCHLSFKA